MAANRPAPTSARDAIMDSVAASLDKLTALGTLISDDEKVSIPEIEQAIFAIATEMAQGVKRRAGDKDPEEPAYPDSMDMSEAVRRKKAGLPVRSSFMASATAAAVQKRADQHSVKWPADLSSGRKTSPTTRRRTSR